MSKTVSAGLLLAAVAIGVTSVWFSSEATIEDVGEAIALKILEALPRKNKENYQRPEMVEESAPVAAPSATEAPPSNVDEDEFVPPSKLSRFDPVGHYNARNAMENRYKNLRKTCMRLNDFLRPERVMGTATAAMESYVFDPPSQMAVCTAKPVASNNMRSLFERIRKAGNEHEDRLEYFKSNFPRSLKEAKRAIVVRHPMERVVAAFRSNFEMTYNPIDDTHEGGDVTFRDFAEALINGPVEFGEFLAENNLEGESTAVDTSLMDGTGVSSAWNPFWRQCAVCNPDYMPHYILHLEHFKEDAQVFIELLGERPNANAWLQVDWEKKSGETELEQHYWSQLTKDEIRSLYDKFRVDHELFGYSPDYYIALGRD